MKTQFSHKKIHFLKKRGNEVIAQQIWCSEEGEITYCELSYTDDLCWSKKKEIRPSTVEWILTCLVSDSQCCKFYREINPLRSSLEHKHLGLSWEKKANMWSNVWTDHRKLKDPTGPHLQRQRSSQRAPYKVGSSLLPRTQAHWAHCQCWSRHSHRKMPTGML